MSQKNGISLNGADTLIIGGRSITDNAGPISFEGEFPNDVATCKVGKNGNAVIALNNMGKMMNAKVYVLLGSGDDDFFNQELSRFEADPPSYVLLPITFTKRSGDGDGNAVPVQYIGQGGHIKKAPKTLDQAEGDSEQGIVVWEMVWPQVIRTVG